jgi:hypothetical protein
MARVRINGKKSIKGESQDKWQKSGYWAKVRINGKSRDEWEKFG